MKICLNITLAISLTLVFLIPFPSFAKRVPVDAQGNSRPATTKPIKDPPVIVEEDIEPPAAPVPVGEEAARKSFSERKNGGYSGQAAPITDDTHYLALHLGGFVDSDSWKWASENHKEGPGKLTLGVSYRIGEWVRSFDFLFRGDFNSYELKEGRTVKLSLIPMVTFPDATSRFPLYFGGGIGLGIFFNPIRETSPLSIDYQLIAGARFFNVAGSVGFFLEGGLKNHLNLLSSGQFNGTFIAVGSVFTF